MKLLSRLWGLGIVAALGIAATGCCPELREFVQKKAVEVPETKTFTFTVEDCFDTSKEVTVAALWKGGKQTAKIQINDLDVAELKEQTCDLAEQAASALGDAVGGAIGEIGCAVHLIQGPEFDRDDRVAVQDLKKDKFKWQVFTAKDVVSTGKNEITLTISSDQNCTGDDKRSVSQIAYLMVSEVDKPCDEKFKD